MKFSNKNFSNIILSTVALIALSGVIFVNKASALTLSPARIEIIGDPGTTIIKNITLLNDNKNASETYYVSYANFESQGESGSPRFVEPKNGLGTWMNVTEFITLKPEESKTIPLEIKIPQDAYAGGHFAVVFFGNNPNEKNGGQVSVGAKTGTLVLLSVNGSVLEAGGLSYFNTEMYTKKNGKSTNKFFYNSLPVNFEYRWKNDGNDRVKPEGDITIRNMFYWPVSHIDANSVSGNILPHSTRLFNVEWVKYKAKDSELIGSNFIDSFFKRVSYQWKNFAMGPYMAKIDLVYGEEANRSSKMTYFFVLPWQLLLVILIMLTGVFYVGRKLLRVYNKHIIEQARLSMNTQNDANHV